MDRRIYFLKGIAICGVLLCHTSSASSVPDTARWLVTLASWCQWCVPLFLFCAGVLHGRSVAKQSKPFLPYALTRTRRLLAPWLLVQLANKLVWFVVITAGFYAGSHLSYVVRSRWSFFGGQFYFLPLLFCISVPVHAILCWRRPAAVWGVCLLALAGVLIFFPAGPFLGWHFGAFCWGMFMYSAGVLVQERMATIRLPASRPLELVGEASGTIFLYHLPFITPAAMIIATKLVHEPVCQFAAALLAMAVSIAFLTWTHFRLKTTRLRWLLL